MGKKKKNTPIVGRYSPKMAAANKPSKKMNKKAMDAQRIQDQKDRAERLKEAELLSGPNLVEFFDSAGKVVHIQLIAESSTSTEKFPEHFGDASSAVAQKALEMAGSSLSHSADTDTVRLDLVPEYREKKKKVASPLSKGDVKEEELMKLTVLVRGFKESNSQKETRASLMEHFQSCGRIETLHIPMDTYSRFSKGVALMQFGNMTAFKRALNLNGSEIESGYKLEVEEKTKDEGGIYSGNY